MLLRYAAEHGYTVQEVYIDEDYSGADRRRPAFNQMLAAAERREFDVILAKTQSPGPRREKSPANQRAYQRVVS